MLPVTVPFPLREPPRNSAVGEKEMFPPVRIVWPPFWVYEPKLSIPVLAWMVPELVQVTDTRVVPLPALLRNVPLFASEGVPPLGTNPFPSLSKSMVALGLLLKTAVLIRVTPAFVHVPAPLLTSMPPASVFPKPLLMVSPPLAERTRVEPAQIGRAHV